MRRWIFLGILALSLGMAQETGGMTNRELLLPSASENEDQTEVTLPLYEGRTPDGRAFWYVLSESSDEMDASARRVSAAPLLAGASMTRAVQQGSFDGEVLLVAATVDFSPERVVTPGMTSAPFPPAEAVPGSVGEEGYSPLVELETGVVLNASHVANDSGQHDKVVAIDHEARTVTLSLTEGFHGGNEVYYISLDASDALPAALEGVTYAPALAQLPASASSPLAVFVNGQTGADNGERQGLYSALAGDPGSPFNVVQSIPGEAAYSPLWNLFMSVWSEAAVMAGENLRQTDFGAVAALSSSAVGGPDGAPWAGSGLIVNCPIVSITRQ